MSDLQSPALRLFWVLSLSGLVGCSGLFEDIEDFEYQGDVALDAGVEDAGVEDVGDDPDVEGCAEGETRCDGRCVDTDEDTDHCGSCDNRCNDPARGSVQCRDGVCEVECDFGYGACGVRCVDFTTDPDHCGGCGEVFECETDEVCSAEVCRKECDEWLTQCSRSCVDLDTNVDHCGGCGERCAAPKNGWAICEAGSCGVDCDEGFEICDGELCVDLFEGISIEDGIEHCGECGEVCDDPEDGSSSCVDGSCEFECDDGFEACDGECLPAAAFADDVEHCGGCGNTCPAPENALPACDGGECDFRCEGDFERCGDECIDTERNPAHCGECDHPCDEDLVCAEGICEETCPEGEFDCAGTCRPEGVGFEICGDEDQCVDTSDHPDHCGECEKSCDGSEPVCDGGECVECSEDGQCESEVCEGGECQEPSCEDGVKNGEETDVDCGGPECAGCELGQSCEENADCESEACSGGECVECIDGQE